MKQKLFPLFITPCTISALFVFAPRASAWTVTPSNQDDVFFNPTLSANGKYLIAFQALSNKTWKQVQFYDTTKSTPIWKFDPPAAVFGHAISSDGQRAAVVGSKVWMFGKKNNKPLWTAKVGINVFDTGAFSGNGKYFVVGSRLSNIFLFKKSSSKIVKTWSLGENEDGVNSLSVSNNGRYILVGTDASVTLLDRTKNKIVWRATVPKDVQQVFITGDAKYAVAAAGSNVYYFNAKKQQPLWSKEVKGRYGIETGISSDGKTVLAATDKTAHVYNNAGTELWSTTLKESLKGSATLSQNSRYTLIDQGESYLMLFDNAYGSGNKPFHVYTDTHPRYATMNKDGTNIAYGFNGITTTQPVAGVIATVEDTPVYLEGSTASVRIFASNPGVANDHLRAKIIFSLPQLNWWSAQTAMEGFTDQPPEVRSKLMEYSASALPGYREIDDITFPTAAGSYKDETVEREVPDLAMPSWVSDITSILEAPTNAFSQFMDAIEGPLSDVIGDDAADLVTNSITSVAGGDSTLYPVMGIGTVQLYDDSTDTILDQDSFTFIYLAKVQM